MVEMNSCNLYTARVNEKLCDERDAREDDYGEMDNARKEML